MKLITSVGIRDSRDPAALFSDSSTEVEAIRSEIINGRRFCKIVSDRDKDGEIVDEVIYDFVIGATADVNGIFGAYCEGVHDCFERLEEEKEYSDQLEKRNKELREELNAINSLTFWQKLARLFT